MATFVIFQRAFGHVFTAKSLQQLTRNSHAKVDGSRSAEKDLARSNPVCIPLCFVVLAFVALPLYNLH